MKPAPYPASRKRGVRARDFSAMLDTLLAFLLPIPEFATSQEFSAYTTVPAHAPIHIDACEASQAKQRGVYAHSTLEYGVAFTILGEKPARRVRLRFAFDDRTWHPVSISRQTVDGTFTPGAKISRTHRYGGPFKEARVAKDAVAVVCSPEEIEFADGSVWQNHDSLSKPAPKPDQE